MFTAPAQRIDRISFGKPTHHYEDANGKRIPGVTTILNDGLPKPALINWAANATAEATSDANTIVTAASCSPRWILHPGAPRWHWRYVPDGCNR